MKAEILLENMQFHAGHGCYDLEKIVGNNFSVDIMLTADVTQAAERDDLTESVNYLTVYEVVRREMTVTSNIIENVALRIGRAVRDQFPQVEKATVKISKLAPPLGGKIEKVSVIVTV